jgi:hypothetical protein
LDFYSDGLIVGHDKEVRDIRRESMGCVEAIPIVFLSKGRF